MTATNSIDTTSVRLRTKLGFWLLIGMMSTAVAEVISGSFIFGWLFVLPVYLLHSVVGLWLVHRFGKPVFATLFLTGMLFGFYEFYLTKVLWAPPWGTSIALGGVDIISLIILTMWWHPIFAFIGPLTVVEAVATSTRSLAANLPFNLGQASRRTAMILFVTVAAVQGFLAQGFIPAAISAGTTISALVLVIWWWCRSEERRSLPLVSLVPSDRQAIALIVGLAAMYVLYGFQFTPEAIPALPSHITTWLLYVAVTVPLIAALRRSARSGTKGWPGPQAWWPPRWGPVTTAYGLIVLACATTGLSAIAYVVIWGAGIILGPILTLKAARYAIGGGDTTHESPEARDAPSEDAEKRGDGSQASLPTLPAVGATIGRSDDQGKLIHRSVRRQT